MKGAIFLAICIVAVYGIRPDRPDFDCPRWCSRYGYDPKCSVDGKTYYNDCFLECEWNYKECDGPCPCHGSYYRPRPVYYEPRRTYCYCEPKYDPVCATDGETYDNKCAAECEGKMVWYDGRCY